MNETRLREILSEEEFYPDQRAELDDLVKEHNPEGWSVGFVLDGRLIVHNVDFDCLLPFEDVEAARRMSPNHYALLVREAAVKSDKVFALLKVYSSSDLSDHEIFLASYLPGGRWVLAHNGGYFDTCPIVALE